MHRYLESLPVLGDETQLIFLGEGARVGTNVCHASSYTPVKSDYLALEHGGNHRLCLVDVGVVQASTKMFSNRPLKHRCKMPREIFDGVLGCLRSAMTWEPVLGNTALARRRWRTIAQDQKDPGFLEDQIALHGYSIVIGMMAEWLEGDRVHCWRGRLGALEGVDKIASCCVEPRSRHGSRDPEKCLFGQEVLLYRWFWSRYTCKYVRSTR